MHPSYICLNQSSQIVSGAQFESGRGISFLLPPTPSCTWNPPTSFMSVFNHTRGSQEASLWTSGGMTRNGKDTRLATTPTPDPPPHLAEAGDHRWDSGPQSTRNSHPPLPPFASQTITPSPLHPPSTLLSVTVMQDLPESFVLAE